MLCPRTL